MTERRFRQVQAWLRGDTSDDDALYPPVDEGPHCVWHWDTADIRRYKLWFRRWQRAVRAEAAKWRPGLLDAMLQAGRDTWRRWLAHYKPPPHYLD